MILKRKSMPFVIASLLFLPFLAFLVLNLIDWALIAANIHRPDFIEVPLFLGFFWLGVLTFMSLPVLVFVSIFIYRAWFQEGKTRFEVVFTSIYSVVILVYIGWVLFCIFSGQKWDV